MGFQGLSSFELFLLIGKKPCCFARLNDARKAACPVRSERFSCLLKQGAQLSSEKTDHGSTLPDGFLFSLPAPSGFVKKKSKNHYMHIFLSFA